jgi:alpha-beta hydrolase superfamily lysophospholipase
MASGAVVGLGACSADVAGPDTMSEASSTTDEQACKPAIKDTKFGRRIRTSYFTGIDGNPVRYREYYKAEGKPTVIFLHGRAEFIEKYDVLFTSLHEYPVGNVPASQTLANMDVNFVAIDHEGHGKSVEGRVASHVENFDNFVEDIRILIGTLSYTKNHRKPIILMSHSMGGMISAAFAQKYPGAIDGLALSSPMLAVKAPAPLSTAQLGNVAAWYKYVAQRTVAEPPAPPPGFPTLCTAAPGIDRTGLVTIAVVNSDDTLRSCFNDSSLPYCGALTQCLLMGLPNDCGAPAIDFAGLKGAYDYLMTQGDGCADRSMTCPDQGLVTDDAYCAYTAASPLHGPQSTVGWVFESIKAGAQFQAGPPVAVPTLILSNTNDVVVDASLHTCSKFSGRCNVVQYTDRGHEMLAGAERAEPIAQIRTFIKSILKK